MTGAADPFEQALPGAEPVRSEDGRSTLADFIDSPAVYSAGRLDYDSEGLLLLSDDASLRHRLTHPRFRIRKHYWVQVEGKPSDAALERLTAGVESRGQRLRADRARRIDAPPLWERDPPIRYRKNVPDSWVEIVLSEGKNRQVRRMTAAVGHPALRLVRHRIGPWSLLSLKPGESHRIAAGDALSALREHGRR